MKVVTFDSPVECPFCGAEYVLFRPLFAPRPQLWRWGGVDGADWCEHLVVLQGPRVEGPGAFSF